jgi:hypothetical protein
VKCGRKLANSTRGKYCINHYLKSPEHIQKVRKYYQDNKVRILKRQKIAYNLNKDKFFQKTYSYRNKRCKIDAVYKMKLRLSSRINKALKRCNGNGYKSTVLFLGAPLDIVRKHIENQFTQGMSWKNYGINGWHVDHIIPLSSGKTYEDIKRLCHYTNLQPLWALDNIRKGNR